MFPVLLKLGPVVIYTSSIFMIIAFFASTYVFWRKGKEEHYAEEELLDGYFISVLFALLWSRVGYIVLHLGDFGLQPLNWLDVFNHPGFTPIVGTIAAVLSLYRFAQKQKWDEFEILDFGSLALSLVIAILWLGNFFAGAELGTPTALPWGVQFPHLFDKRHPVQLYGFVLYLFVFIYLFWVESRYRTFEWYRAKKDSAQSGFLFAMFCIFTGVFGLLLWLFSSSQVVFFGVPIEPILRVVLIIYGLVVLFRRSGRSVNFRRGK